MTRGISNLPRSTDFPSSSWFSRRIKTLDAETMTEAYEGEGFLVNSGPFNGMESPEGEGGHRASTWRRKELGGKRISLPAEGLGDLEAALLGSAHSHHLLRSVRDRACSGEETFLSSFRYNVEVTGMGESPLAGAKGICGDKMSEMRWSGPKGNGHDGHLCRILLVF